MPYGYCQCGCGEMTKIAPETSRKDGYLKGEPRRYVAGHNGLTSRVAYVEQDMGHDTPCWIWQRGKSGGYGTIGGRHAHAVYFEEHNGALLPGYHVHHLCPAKLCVNPEHLQALSHESHSRVTMLESGVNPGRVLTADDVLEIRRLRREEKLTLFVIAGLYGKTPAAISKIVRRATWKHI